MVSYIFCLSYEEYEQLAVLLADPAISAICPYVITFLFGISIIIWITFSVNRNMRISPYILFMKKYTIKSLSSKYHASGILSGKIIYRKCRIATVVFALDCCQALTYSVMIIVLRY